jgi:hypothetical protein
VPATARGIVYAKGPTGAHYFNIVNHGGDVMLLDGQLGKVMSWATYREMGFNQFSLLRTNERPSPALRARPCCRHPSPWCCA